MSGSAVVGDVVVFPTDADNNYPHAGKFNHILTGDTYYNGEQYDDSHLVVDYPSNHGLQVNMYDDSGDFGPFYEYNSGQSCSLLMFDHDPTTSDDGFIGFYEGAHINYDGSWPDKSSSIVRSKSLKDSNLGNSEKRVEDIYNDLSNTGYDGQSVSGNTGNMELIRGASDWRLKGDLLCGDHNNNGDGQWKICRGSGQNGDSVTIDGDDWVCDGNDDDWFKNNNPTAQFTVSGSVSDGQLSVGEQLVFDAGGSGNPSDSSEHDGIYAYRWDWNNDGTWDSTSSGAYASDTGYHTFNSGGSKTVTLQVEDQWGKTAETTQTIVISDDCLYGDDAGGAANNISSEYTDYGQDVSFTLEHNNAGTCPSESQLEFNVCGHTVEDQHVTKTSEQYNISFNVPTDIPCSWGAAFPSNPNVSHPVNITRENGDNIVHERVYLNVYAKGNVADPHSGYYIYVEQSVQHDPNNLSGMWLTNQTWYDCDGCGAGDINTYPDNGTANSRNLARGAKFVIEQEDGNKPDGTRHEAGVWHAQYGAIIENRTGVALSNYASEPANAERDGNCGNSECWWLGNNYQNLTAVYNQQFTAGLKESFTDAAVVY